MKNQPSKPEQNRTPSNNPSANTMGKQPDTSARQGSAHDRDMPHKSGSSKDHAGETGRHPGGHKDR